MSHLKIAPVRWFLGQTVLPEHLRAQQASCDAVSDLRSRFFGRPSYGIAELTWSEPLLLDGVLSITSLTAVLPDGQIVSVPGNASVSPLSLKATSATQLPVYLHLTDEELGREGNRTYDSDARVVERVLHRAYLGISDKHDRATGSMKLGEFRKEADGRWVLTEDHLPPLLQVSTTPYFERALADLEARVTNLEPQMVAQLQDTFLRPER
ncbi:MAG TPA: type VI secretion system baseplate subunit TssK, partial [Pseudomonadota bacterium]|nr:type VI secretion system baseplate subunit TssK [Pseudomonadota bacterium]